MGRNNSEKNFGGYSFLFVLFLAICLQAGERGKTFPTRYEMTSYWRQLIRVAF